jgi:ABC-type microcin C transport system permease subunit YejB
VATFKASYLSAFGFNQPFPVKYALQMSNLFQFHLGSAFFLQAPNGSKQVTDIIVAYLPNTILLFTTGTLLVVGCGRGPRTARREVGRWEAGQVHPDHRRDPLQPPRVVDRVRHDRVLRVLA